MRKPFEYRAEIYLEPSYHSGSYTARMRVVSPAASGWGRPEEHCIDHEIAANQLVELGCVEMMLRAMTEDLLHALREERTRHANPAAIMIRDIARSRHEASKRAGRPSQGDEDQ